MGNGRGSLSGSLSLGLVVPEQCRGCIYAAEGKSGYMNATCEKFPSFDYKKPGGIMLGETECQFRTIGGTDV